MAYRLVHTDEPYNKCYINFRKGLVPVDWQQRFYVEIAAAS